MSTDSPTPIGVLTADVFLERLAALGFRSSNRLVVDYLPRNVCLALFDALINRADQQLDILTPSDDGTARRERVLALAGDGYDVIPWLVTEPGGVNGESNRGSEGFASSLRDHYATGEERPRVLVVITGAAIETQRSAQDRRADKAMVNLDRLLEAVLEQSGVAPTSPLRQVARAYRAHRSEDVGWVRFVEDFERYVEEVAIEPPEIQGAKLPMLGCFLKDERAEYADGPRVLILEDRMQRQRQRGEGRLFDNAVLQSFLADTLDDPIVDAESVLVDVFVDDPERARKIAQAGPSGLTELDLGTFAGIDQKKLRRRKNQFDRNGMVVRGAAMARLFGQGNDTVLVVTADQPFTVEFPLTDPYEPKKEHARVVRWNGATRKVALTPVVAERGTQRLSFEFAPDPDQPFRVCQLVLARGARTLLNPIDSVMVAVYNSAEPEIVVEEDRRLSLEEQAWVAEGVRQFHWYVGEDSTPLEEVGHEVIREESESGPEVLAISLNGTDLRPQVIDQAPEPEPDTLDSRVYAYEPLLELACSTTRLGYATTAAMKSKDQYLQAVAEIHEGLGRWKVDLVGGNTREVWAAPPDTQDPFFTGRAVARLLLEPAAVRLERRPPEWIAIPFVDGEPAGSLRFYEARTRVIAGLRALAEKRVPRFRRVGVEAAVPVRLLPLAEIRSEILDLLAAWNTAVDDTSDGIHSAFAAVHEGLLQTDTLRVFDANGALERLVVLPTHPWLLAATLTFQERFAENVRQARVPKRQGGAPKWDFDLTREEVAQMVPQAALENWYVWHGVSGALRITDGPPFELTFLPEDRHVHRTPLDYVGRVVANKVGRYLRMHPHLRDERRTLRIGFVNPGDGGHLLAGLQSWLRNLMKEHSGRIRELPTEAIPAIEVLLFAREGEIGSAGAEFTKFFQEQVSSGDEDVVRQTLASRIQYRVSAGVGPRSQRDAVHICFVHGLVDGKAQRDKSGQLAEWWDGAFGDGLLSTWLRRTVSAGSDHALHSRRGLWINPGEDGLRGGLARILALQRACRYGDLNPDSGIFWECSLPRLEELTTTYEHSDWVVHLDRELSLEIFRAGDPKDRPTIIEYSDQEVPESPGYDTITVTRRAEPYREQLGEILTMADLDVSHRGEEAKIAANQILEDINILSGSWALDFLLGSIADERTSTRLKGNVGAALVYRWLRRMEMTARSAMLDTNVGPVVPVLISLEDLLRATPAAGLSRKEGLVYRYTNEVADTDNAEAARWCDDLLVLYLTPTEAGQRSRLYGRVIEVKFGRTARGAADKAIAQVSGTQRLLTERLSGGRGPLDAPFRHKQLSLLIKAQLEQAVAMGIMPADVYQRLNVPALSTNLARGDYEVDYEISLDGQHLKGDAFLLDTSESNHQGVNIEVYEGVRVVTIPRRLVEWLAFEMADSPTLTARPESTFPRLGKYRSLQTLPGTKKASSMVNSAAAPLSGAAPAAGAGAHTAGAGLMAAPVAGAGVTAPPVVAGATAAPVAGAGVTVPPVAAGATAAPVAGAGATAAPMTGASVTSAPAAGAGLTLAPAALAPSVAAPPPRPPGEDPVAATPVAPPGGLAPPPRSQMTFFDLRKPESPQPVGDNGAAPQSPAPDPVAEPSEPTVTLDEALLLPVKVAPYADSSVVDAVKRLEKALVGHKVRLASSPSARETDRGPRLLRAYVRLEAGESIGAVRRISEDIARVVGTATSDIHITNVPERHAVGLDLPLPGLTYSVSFDDVATHPTFEAAQRELRLGFCAGIDVTGRAVWVDLATMPHMLVAGTTGSGKTVFLRNLILTLLLNNGAKDLVLRLSSSKPMDFRVFTQAPHCGGREMARDPIEARQLADELVVEMERRYVLLDKAMCDNLAEYNAEDPARAEPFIVAVFDEYAEMIASFGDKADREAFEGAIGRLAQKARAAGIHLVVCMQRPDANALKGGIKSNILHRFALKLPQNQDSRIILDENGAETLLGQGDMLYKDANSRLFRLQVPFLENSTLKAAMKRIVDGVVNGVDPAAVKSCPRCGRTGPTGELFGTRKMRSKRRDGTEVVVERPQSYCKECRRG